MTTEEANYIVYHYYYYVLHFCGCYTPETAIALLKEGLEVFEHFPKEEQDDTWQKRIAWVENNLILTYLLDSKGLLEHGGNISGSWLQPKGEKLLAALRAFDERWNECVGWYTPEEEAAFMKEWANR